MEVAALGLKADSSQIRDATLALKEMPPAATAAERAAQRWGVATTAAGRSSEEFGRRVQGTIKQLEFERQQLTRNAAEQQRHAALRRAGVTEASAQGKAILAAVAALQAQRAAIKASAESTGAQTIAVKAASASYALLARSLGPMAAALSAAALAQSVWNAGMKAADYGEQAEQIGITTDELQAYRFAGAQAGIQTEQMDTAITKLAKTMGAAADGGKEQIELFDKLGVKLLDAQGELRPVADVLPEVARGVLNIGSSSQRTATLMELFGRSGAKMATVLQDVAAGNDQLIRKAREAGVILDAEVIKAWDDLSDSLGRVALAADTTFAKLGAPIATAALAALEQLLKSINGLMDQINSKEGFWASVLSESRAKGRIGNGPNALRLETPEEEQARRRTETEAALNNPNNSDIRNRMLTERLARMNAADIVAGGFYGEDMGGAALKGARAPAISPAGARNPSPRGGGGGSDPYAKAIDSAREYILAKNAETAAIGLNVEAASRLKHEQDLLNKVMSDGKTITDAQRGTLQALAVDMAAADSTFATGKFMEDAKQRTADFLADQQIERESIFMSTEAAMAYRLEKELINQATAAGITLTSEQTAAIQAYAGQMSAAEAQTRALKDAFDFAKQTASGFFADLRQGLQEGQGVWDAFANAGINALNKIADKLFEMAMDALITQLLGSLLGGGFGGGAGIFGSLIGGLFKQGAAFQAGSVIPFAAGAAFRAADVVPFAAGGAIVNRPTTFPMSGGRTGLMGEAGPEAIVPLGRGRDGKLGIRMTGGGRGDDSGRRPAVNITVAGDTDLVRVTARDEFGRGIAVAGPQIENRAVKRAGQQAPAIVRRHDDQTGGEWRTGR